MAYGAFDETVCTAPLGPKINKNSGHLLLSQLPQVAHALRSDQNTKIVATFIWASYQNSKNSGLPEFLRWHKHFTWTKKKCLPKLLCWSHALCSNQNSGHLSSVTAHTSSSDKCWSISLHLAAQRHRTHFTRTKFKLIVFYCYMCYLRYWPCIVV